MNFLRRAWAFILALPKVYSIGGAIIIVALGLVMVHAATKTTTSADIVSAVSHVRVASVGSLSSASGPLPVTGKVTSLNQATILAQSAGEITSLRVSIGSRVGAGQVLASFENSSQAAAVQQAEGAYDGANAALAKATGSTATNAGITSTQASQSAANSATAFMTALQSAYASLDDAVNTKADTMFSNPHSITPALNLTLPDNQLAITLQNQRSQLDSVLADAKRLSNDSTTSIDAKASAMNANAQKVIDFLNNLVKATNTAITSQTVTSATLATYQAAASAARSEAVAAVSAVTTQKSAYDAAVAGAQTASNSATAGNQNDVAAAAANVKQALGALNSARANLEKTIVRSPISGTIVSLPVTRGDFVSNFAQIAEVSNPGALEIVAYVTSDDAKTITVGNKATIGESIGGIITSVAPAVDPTTGKIEVKIGITGTQKTLTDGDTVTVTLERTAQTTTSTKPAAQAPAIRIPIAAAKITPSGTVVFTVSQATLVAHPITLGSILGEQITVLSGLTVDMEIVKDARGLSNGQTVVVDTN
jgi:RND family efflux transporter MFP subunit